MKIRKVYFENQGYKVESILHLPENKTNSLVILVHGFTGSINGPGGLFIKLAEELASKGFAVLRFNFRFTTDDWSEFHKMTMKGEVSDLKLIINKMSKKYDKIALVGESMGGSISILAYNEKIKCLVLWYTALFRRETALAKRFLSEEKLQELEQTGFIKGKKSNGQEYKVGKEFIEEIKNIDLIPYAKKISSPTLLIHGDVDDIVPFSHSEILLTILKGPKKLEKIIGANHAWENEDYTDYNLEAQKLAIKLTIEWFDKYLK
ncbi:MAG: alpha/beta fold hydrolase [Candidatus Aenigmarchaeota archaeon]|nr:alpha/beta fold hydrolase [Candidatus Aenigmarchaeota archaeon]